MGGIGDMDRDFGINGWSGGYGLRRDEEYRWEVGEYCIFF